MLKKIYDILFYSCRHEYKTVSVIKLLMTEYDKFPHGLKIIQECKKCGKINVERN